MNPNIIPANKALAAVKQDGDALRFVRDDATYDNLNTRSLS